MSKRHEWVEPPPAGPDFIKLGIEAHESLLWIVDRWPDLRARLHPSRGQALTGMPGHSADPPAPIDLHVSDLMFEIEQEARSLGHVLMDETADWTPPTSSMPGLLRSVAERYGHWMAGDERTALAFYDWAEDVRHRVTKTLERPAPPRYIGPCPEGECVGELYVRPHWGSVKCWKCKTVTTVESQMVYVRSCLESRLMTQAEIRSALMILGIPVSQPLISTWAARGKLVEVVDGLYRLTDAIGLAQRHTRKSA